MAYAIPTVTAFVMYLQGRTRCRTIFFTTYYFLENLCTKKSSNGSVEKHIICCPDVLLAAYMKTTPTNGVLNYFEIV